MVDFEPRRTAAKARRLLLGGGGTTETPRNLEAGGRAQMRRVGPPNDDDKRAIATHLRATAGANGPMTEREAEGIASRIVAAASGAVAELAGGRSGNDFDVLPTVSLEAVLHTRGRPAVRLIGEDFEDFSIYPGAEIWQAIADAHRRDILDVCGSTGAVVVRDVYAPAHPWVQGTAWLIAHDLAITNRHVLFPPIGGTAIARRIPGTTRSRFKPDYAVTIDFAFDSGAVRDIVYAVTDVPFVAEPNDTVDVALLKVLPLGKTKPEPLVISHDSVAELDRLYVVGHPGKLDEIPAEVRTVFGDPDERKRVSFGTNMDEDTVDPPELIHDASTIGGYSGGCVLGFMSKQVRALHYYGDSTNGNRAIAAPALHAHPVLGAMLP